MKLKQNCPTKSMQVLLFSEVVSMMNANDEKDAKTASKWLRDMKADIGDGEIIELDKLQRYSLIKLLFKSPYFTNEEKNMLLNRERNIDFGDVDDIENYGV